MIPTAQNLASLHADLNACAARIAGDSEEAVRPRLETLVRAYDPCISCATH